MNSKEIASFIGRHVMLRKLGFFFIQMTTLREWYLNNAVKRTLQTYTTNFDFLDAGSGMGQHALDVAREYDRASVTGIEIDGEQVQDCNDFALKIGLDNVRFYQGDLSTFNFDNNFDAVFCSSVLEHIDDDVTVMKSLYQALRSNGSLIVYVPTSERRVLSTLERTIESRLRKNKEKYPHQHVRYYTKDEMTAKLQSVGFDVMDASITYGSFGRLAYDIVTTVQYSPVFKLIFPFYFILVHPFVLLLMWADLYMKNRDGNGLMILAKKN